MVATTTAAGTLAMGPVVGALAPRRAIQVAGLVVAATVASSARCVRRTPVQGEGRRRRRLRGGCLRPRRTIVIGRAAIRLCPVTRLLFGVSCPMQAPLGLALDLLGPAWLSPFNPAWLIPSSERGDGRWVRAHSDSCQPFGTRTHDQRVKRATVKAFFSISRQRD